MSRYDQKYFVREIDKLEKRVLEINRWMREISEVNIGLNGKIIQLRTGTDRRIKPIEQIVDGILNRIKQLEKMDRNVIDSITYLLNAIVEETQGNKYIVQKCETIRKLLEDLGEKESGNVNRSKYWKGR